MSIEQNKTLKCPACEHENSFTMWKSLNTSLNPEMKQKLISGELFIMKCTECGAVTNVNYPILYHDMGSGLMIHMVPDERDAEEVAETFGQMKAMEPQMAETYRLRIVRNVNSLREKAYIFDRGLDDRAIEIMKVIVYTKLQEQDPAGQVEELLLEITEGDPEYFAARMSDGQWLEVSFLKDLYDTVMKEYVEGMKETGNDYAVDFVWATEAIRKKHLGT